MKNATFNSSRNCTTEERRARGKKERKEKKKKKKTREVETTPAKSHPVFLYSDTGGQVTQSLTHFVCGDLVTFTCTSSGALRGEGLS